MSYLEVSVSITLKAPWCVPGGSLSGEDVDIRLARNSKEQFILPGTLLQGVVRGAAQAISEKVAGPLAAFDGSTIQKTESASFGALSPDGTNDPNRGFAIVGDLTAANAPEPSEGRTVRVEIDAERGAAKEGHLVFIECPYRHGTPVTFIGKIIVTGQDAETNAVYLVELMKMSLQRVHALGGMKSVGFGKVIGFNVETPVRKVPAEVPAPATALEVTYTVDRPFLVNSTRHGNNYEVSAETLPGTAIKAVLARAFADQGIEATEFLAALHASDAPPGIRSEGRLERRCVPPLSLAIEDCGFSDQVALCALYGGAPKGLRRFSGDWKNPESKKMAALLKQKGGEAFVSDELPTEARTRTAIDGKTGGALIREDGGALFSERLIVPDGHVWIGSLQGDGPFLNEVCSVLETGAPGFGSTGAILSGNVSELTENAPTGRDQLALTLQSRAHLFFGSALRERLHTDPEALATLYKDYFASHELELIDFRAAQTLVGGYLAKRYPVEPKAGYQPWLVTVPGSTFLLRVGPEADLADILRRGLKPAMSNNADWQNFPFLREVGFGAVRDNTDLLRGLGAGAAL